MTHRWLLRMQGLLARIRMFLRQPGCADCGEPYGSQRFPDLIIDGDAWRAISPDGEGNGLLCPNCICARLDAAGLHNVRGEFRSGPLARFGDAS